MTNPIQILLLSVSLRLIMSELKNKASRNNRQLIVKVAVTLACKIAIIACLGFLFFGSDKRVETDPQSVGQALLADTAPVSSATESNNSH